MSSSIVVRKCAALEEFHACVNLQREIWQETDLELEPVGLFVVATHTGGQVLAAFDGATMIGYTLALPGVHEGNIFLHSHYTGVLEQYRDRGVGRRLKLLQREEALSRGIRSIHWTFDPLELRNAHFNLNRLGAICCRYEPNLYGVTTSPLHRGLATDRLVAEWHLDSTRVADALQSVVEDTPREAAFVELPKEMEQWKEADPEQVKRTQSRICAEFKNWFARGYAAVGTRETPTGSAYVLVPSGSL
jgi:predicted GNAT superfamily acetyltransferase